MAVTTPPTIDALPPAPSINSPSTFPTLADAFVAALDPFGDQVDAVAANVYANAVDAETSASEAQTSAGESAASASAAETSAGESAASAAQAVATTGVSIWISGTTYAIGDCRFSPATYQTFRRKTDGGGTTDPASDTANWTQISGLAPAVGSTLYLNATLGGF